MKDIANIIGSRIAGRPTYTPAHQIPGVDKIRSAKIEFNVFKNRGEKKLVFRVTAWGGMADAIARGGAVGKKFTFSAEIIPFEGRTWMPMPDGTHQFVTKPDGTPLTQWKTGYTVMDMEWGKDSAKTVANEIAQGLRPIGWDNPASPDRAAWLQICANRNAAQFVQGATTFEYADVNIANLPQGAVIVLGKVANNAAPVNTGQVIVNGQQMGYAMPAAQPVTQPVQYVANMPAVNTAIPAGQPVQGQTGYAQPVQNAVAVQPGGYSPVTM